MKKINLAVTGITKEEFYEAGHRNALRFYKTLALTMVIMCALLMLASMELSARAIVWPVAIYAAVVLIYEIIIRRGYKDQFKEIDPVEYVFTEEDWQVSSAGQTVKIAWKKTPNLAVTKRSLYVYNDTVSSCMIPLRFVKEEEVSQIKEWYEQSRAENAEFEKMISEQVRKQRHNNAMKNNPFGRK